jgi:hypothetical protein
VQNVRPLRLLGYINNASTDWTRSSVSEFLTDVAIPSNFPRLLDAKIIYELLLNLGCFPFAAEPPQRLTFEKFTTGMYCLTGRLTDLIYNQGGDESKERSYMRQSYQRHLFQALAVPISGSGCDGTPQVPADDDVSDALKIMATRNYWDPQRGPVCSAPYAPRLPPASDFPSTARLQGKIDVELVKQVLRMSFFLQLYSLRFTPQALLAEQNEIQITVDRIFSAASFSSRELGWEEFRTFFETQMVSSN